MSKPDIWMPLYIREYLGDTMRLTTLQHGAYLLLLMEYWTSGPLPNDDAELAAIAKMEARSWAKIRDPIRRFFAVGEDGLLHQKRCDTERAKAAKISAARRAAASHRWDAADDGPTGGGGAAKAQQNLDGRHAGGEQNGSEAGCKADAIALQQHEQTTMQKDVHARAVPPVTLIPRDSPAAPESRTPRESPPPKMPALDDPPHLWMHLADGRENDTAMVCRPVVAGEYLDLAARKVCEAAGIGNGRWRGDWDVLIAWLRDGLDLNAAILPTIKRVVARSSHRGFTSLRFFDAAVREARAAA